jgi:hypothetical protein
MKTAPSLARHDRYDSRAWESRDPRGYIGYMSYMSCPEARL